MRQGRNCSALSDFTICNDAELERLALRPLFFRPISTAAIGQADLRRV